VIHRAHDSTFDPMALLARHLALFIIDLFRPRAALHAELVRLRHENAVLRRRSPKRVRLTNGDRLFLVWLYRLWPQAAKVSALATPATLLRWHRAGFRAYWRWRSRTRPGRPKIDRAVIEFIRRMARENVLWGAPRIHGELLKLGIDVAQSTVAKYMPRWRRHDGGQSWRTFLANEIDGVAALDLLTVPTIGFKHVYALVVLSLARRRIALVTATSRPTAMWLAQQITEAFPWDSAPKHLIRDNDAKFGDVFRARLRACGIRDRPIAPLSPWQNGYAERVIGSIRRECLDHVIVLGEWHLRRVLADYAAYYNASRTHLALAKDAPDGRPAECSGEIVASPVLGGLHHRYGRSASAQESNNR
jgi:hypothetical protein